MKKKNTYLIVLGLLFVALSVVAFVIPKPKNATFWIGYTFFSVAILFEAYICKLSIQNAKVKKLFLQLPVLYVSSLYLVVQTIFSLVCVSISDVLPMWVVLVVSILLLVVIISITLLSNDSVEYIKNVENKTNKKVQYINEIETDLKLINKDNLDDEGKEKLEELLSKVKYSDPMSNETVLEVEEKINSKMVKLRNRDDNINVILGELCDLFDIRNAKIKIRKQGE